MPPTLSKAPTIDVVDLFCGAGGVSTAVLQACRQLGLRVNLLAVNHWTTALNTHSLNLVSDIARGVYVRHKCEPVENLWPAACIPSRRVHLLCASCECTFHSLANGGKPCQEQSRSQPWQIIRWCTDIQVDRLLMENVREWEDWGPLLAQGLRWRGKYYKKNRPDPRRKGEYFQAFIKALKNLGYGVEYKTQVAANFGDPTSRPRLMLLATLHGHPKLPDHTHGPMTALSRRRIECHSCGTRWKPKARGAAACPTCRLQPHGAARQCIDFSIPGRSIWREDGTLRHCENTMARILAGLEKFGGPAAESFLAILNGTSKTHLQTAIRSMRELMPTLTTSNHILLVEPQFIVQTDHQGGNGAYVRSLNKPLATVVTKQNMLLVQMIMKYYRTGICKSLDELLDTVTTKDRFSLVEVRGIKTRSRIGLDIHTRLLQPHELAAAHSFPRKYKFTGTKTEQTEQIGNSVPVKMARAHALAQLDFAKQYVN